MHVLGIVSLVFWSLVLVIVIKYLTFILRADNHGEGGVLALAHVGATQGPLASRRARGSCSGAVWRALRCCSQTA